MRSSTLFHAGMLAIAFVLSAVAEETTQAPASTAQSVETAQVTTTDSAFSASIEVRPSVSVEEVGAPEAAKSNMPKYTTENTLDLGYQINSKVSAGYRQGFDTNVMSFGEAGGRVNPTIGDTILRAKIKDIWSSGDTSLSYEPRLYLPLAQKLQDAGSVATIRNYVVLSQKVNSTVTVSLMEIPIFHVYNQSGTTTDGKAKANAVLENRVYLLTSVSITENLSLDLPLMVNSVRSANYAGAENNGRLEHKLWMYPELDYAIDKTWTVGAAYYSGNLLSYAGGDLMGVDLSNGLSGGTAQLVVRASL